MLHRERWVRRKVSEIKDSTERHQAMAGTAAGIAEQKIREILFVGAGLMLHKPIPKPPEPDSDPSSPAQLLTGI